MADPVVPAQSRHNGTVPVVPAVPGTGDQEPPSVEMITLADGKTIAWKTLVEYAERHRVRIATLRDRPGASALWNGPVGECTTDAIKTIGGEGLGKQEYRCQLQKLILAERAGVNPYTAV